MKSCSARALILLLLLFGTAVSSTVFAEELLTLQLVARGGRFYPETLDAPAGKRFKIVIKNEGPGPIEFESLSLRREKVLSPGSQSFVVFQPLKPGTYDFFDEFHADTGRGRIVVK